MSARTEQEYRDISSRAVDALGHFANVHSVGIGGRERRGRPTGEIVIKVFVRRKRPLPELGAGDRIPNQFEGMGTDIVECPDQVDANEELPSGARADVKKDWSRYRPIRGGIRIASADRDRGGTLGFFVSAPGPNGPRVFAVTCHHVLFGAGNPSKPNLRVGQPDTDGSLTGCCGGAFGTFKFGHFDQAVDSALVELDGGTEYFADVHEIGVVRGFHPLTAEETKDLNYPVMQRGERSRLTGGIVHAINVGDPTHQRNYKNGIRVKPSPDREKPNLFVRFANHGDSGSALMNNAGQIVGVVFGRSPNLDEVGWATAFPIADLLQAFQTADQLTLTVVTNTQTKQVIIASGAPAALPVQGVIAPEIDAELSRSVNGRLLTSLWLRHGADANRLINANRRLAALWHLNRGPAVLNSLIRSTKNRGTPLPTELDGKEVDVCVRNIFDAFAKYGEDELRDAALSCRGHFPALAGRSYEQILGALE